MSSIGALVVNFLGNAKPLQNTLAGVQNMIGGFAGTIASVLGAGVSIDAAKEDIAAQKKLQAVLTATGYSAGLSAQSIRDLASQLQATTNFADETTVAAAAVLATFKSIKGDEFKDTLAIAQDLATVFDMDLTSATTKLGKALQDPIQGIGSLHKVGISFDEGQKAMIKSLVESGDKMGAQRYILDQLKGSFGGAAAAMASPFKLLQNQLNEIGEEIGKVLLIPMKLLANAVIPFFQKWGLEIAKIATAILAMVGVMRVITTVQKAIAVGQALILSLGGPAGWATLATGAAVFAGSLIAINGQFGEMQKGIDATQSKFAKMAAEKAASEHHDNAFVHQLGDDPKAGEKRDKLTEEFGSKASILAQLAEASKVFGGETNVPWFVREGIIEKASGVIGKTADLKSEIDRLTGRATEADQAIAKMWSIEGVDAAQKQAYEDLLRQRDALLANKKIMDDSKEAAKRIFEDTRTPAEKLTTQLEKIQDIFSKELIDEETRDRAIQKANEDALGKEHGSGAGAELAGAAIFNSQEALHSIFAAMGTGVKTANERAADAAERAADKAEKIADNTEEVASNTKVLKDVDFIAVAV